MAGSGVLEWKLDTLTVRVFTALDEPGSEPGALPDVANVTLINVERNPANPLLGNLTSELTVVVSSNTIEKYVTCSNGQSSEELVIKRQCSYIVLFSNAV